MPVDPWTLQRSPSTSSLGSADSNGRGVGGLHGDLQATLHSHHPLHHHHHKINSDGKNDLNGSTNRSSPTGSSISQQFNSSNSDTLHNSSEDEATTASRRLTADVNQLSIATNPYFSSRVSPPTSQRQQQQQQQQNRYRYFDPSEQRDISAEAKAIETIIRFDDPTPSLQLVTFPSLPSSSINGSSTTASSPFPSYNSPDRSVSNNTAASPIKHHPLPSPSSPVKHSSGYPSGTDHGGANTNGAFQSVRKRLSLNADMRLSESGDTQATETLLPHNNHDTTHPHPPKDPMMANRQAIKDSSKTLTSESATALLVREDLKDNSGVARSQDAPGSGARGSFNGQGRVYSPRASGMIHLQEPKYVDITRRGSTMTSLSDTTQTTYRVNFDTSQNKGYLSEKHSHGSGYDSGRASPLSLSVLSPTTPKSPIGIFGEAGSNNGASAPNGKRYIDTRKRNKKQKAFGKKSFKKHKTLFSNERTFIHWIKFGMLLGSLAMTLLNFSGDEVAQRGIDQTLANRVGRIGKNVGVILMVICLICLVYAAGSYHWRHVGIVKDAGYDRYFDRIGPTFLTIALLGTYVMNVVLTIQVSSLMDHGYAPTVYLNNNPESHNNSPVTTNTSSTTIPQSSNQSIPTSSFQPSPPPSPPLPPPPAPVQPHKPVFDTPYLPPGSTILVDGDGEENEFRGNGNDPTVMTASNNTEEEDHPSDTDTSSDSIKDEPADTRASSSPSSDSDSETAQVTTTSSSDDDE